MSKYVLWRVLHAIPALLGVTVIIFVALRIMPGDPVSIMFGTQATKIRPEDRAKIEADLGLSAPWVVQYLTWLKDIGTGKLGLDHRVGHFRPLSITRHRHLLTYPGTAMSHEGLCQVF